MHAEIFGLPLSAYALFLMSMFVFTLVGIFAALFFFLGFLGQAKSALPAIYSTCLLAFFLGVACVGATTTGLRLYWEISGPPKQHRSELRYVSGEGEGCLCALPLFGHQPCCEHRHAIGIVLLGEQSS